VDVVLSDDDNGDHMMVTAGPPPVVDDVVVLRKTSSEMIIPDLIVTGACDSTAPPTADRAKAAQMTIPTTSGAQLHKRPHIVTKQPDRNHRASEVITHIELSHYRGPHSPLDLVPSEIVFGRILKHLAGCCRLRAMTKLCMWEMIIHRPRGTTECCSQGRFWW
jgi:hypothetical protein